MSFIPDATSAGLTFIADDSFAETVDPSLGESDQDDFNHGLASRPENVVHETNVDEDADKTQFNCSICHDILYRPITITCQHSFCYKCLEHYYNNGNDAVNQQQPQNNNLDIWEPVFQQRFPKKDKCPLCRIPFTLSPIENTLMGELISNKFPEEYKARQQYHEDQEKKQTAKELMESTLRKEIWNAISTNFDTSRPPVEAIQSPWNIASTRPWNDRTSIYSAIDEFGPNGAISTASSRRWDTIKDITFKLMPICALSLLTYTGMELANKLIRNMK